MRETIAQIRENWRQARVRAQIRRETIAKWRAISARKKSEEQASLSAMLTEMQSWAPAGPLVFPRRTPPKELARGYECVQDTGDPGKPPHIVIFDKNGRPIAEIYPDGTIKGHAPIDIIEEAKRKCGKGQFAQYPG